MRDEKFAPRLRLYLLCNVPTLMSGSVFEATFMFCCGHFLDQGKQAGEARLAQDSLHEIALRVGSVAGVDLNGRRVGCVRLSSRDFIMRTSREKVAVKKGALKTSWDAWKGALKNVASTHARTRGRRRHLQMVCRPLKAAGCQFFFFSGSVLRKKIARSEGHSPQSHGDVKGGKRLHREWTYSGHRQRR